MPPTSPAGEEVVEKRASAPVSTACLIIACAALLGGIIFQILEIAEYRSGTGDPKDMAAKRYKADVRKLDEQVEEILSKAASSGTGSPTDTAPGSPTDTAPGAPTDTAPATPGAGDEADPTPGDAPAEPAGEPAPDAGGDTPAEEGTEP